MKTQEDMSVYCEPQCEELYRSDYDDCYRPTQHLDKGWPGDGSGTDDFADYNQNEGVDY
jgi:hypothetical protein